jgi:hypothetical protein
VVVRERRHDQRGTENADIQVPGYHITAHASFDGYHVTTDSDAQTNTAAPTASN